MSKQALKHLRVGIVGSRTFVRLDLVRLALQKIGPCIVVSGGAIGVDTTAVKEAKILGYPNPLIFLPDWKKFGKSAGMIRNKKIVTSSDGLLIFWDGKSKGTCNTLEESKKAHKPIILIIENGSRINIDTIGWKP